MSRLLVLLFAGLLALPASAGLFSDDEARARIDRVKNDLDEVAQRADSASKNQVEFANQVEQIKANISALRGQLEVLTNDLDTTQKRQRDFYVDLDNRLRKIESPTVGEKPDAPANADLAAETRDYEAALTALKASKFADASVGFTAFIKTYPNSTLLPSAHFWSGYCYSQIKQPAKAAEMYGKFATTWPNDPKAPDALLEQANSLDIAGNHVEARKVLENLVEKYPASEAAKKARPRIKPAKRK